MDRLAKEGGVLIAPIGSNRSAINVVDLSKDRTRHDIGFGDYFALLAPARALSSYDLLAYEEFALASRHSLYSKLPLASDS